MADRRPAFPAMVPRRIALGCALTLALAACGKSAVDVAAEETRLMETSRAWSRAAGAGDVEATLDYWADDALVLAPGQARLQGKPALRAYLEQSLKTPGFHIEWEPLEAKVSPDGKMGYLVERTRMSMPGPEGRPVAQEYRGVTIWRKQPDGAWKNVVDISNEPPAAPPAAAP